MTRRNVIHDHLGQTVVPSDTTVLLAHGTWANMPAVETEVFGETVDRLQFDFSPFTQIFLYVNVVIAGFGGAVITLQQSPDDVISYSPFRVRDPSYPVPSNDPEMDYGSPPLDEVGRFGINAPTSFADIAPSMQDRRFVRVVGQDGNGVVDPRFAVWMILR